MAEKDVILMNGTERKRLKVISMAADSRIKQWEAAEKLDLSERQTRRLIKRYRSDGDKGLVHGLRGHESARKIDNDTKEDMINIYAEKYKGFGPTLAHEKFIENEGMKISRESLRKQLIESGLWEMSRKSKKHRHWRERMRNQGDMVQMDGSHHDWLEGRGPWLVIMGYIDDATGNVYAEFHDYEGTKPAMLSFKGYIRKYGIPMKIYLDKHTTYKSPSPETIEDQLEGKKPKSQFERALGELGVEVIHANSPQAKGRVERLFKTFQDRLVKEMRLQGVKSKEEANVFLKSYLPLFNRKFAVEPAASQDIHRKVESWNEVNRILTIKTERTVRNDYTIAHEKKMYQLKTALSLKGKSIDVIELLNGYIRLEYNGTRIEYSEIHPRPKLQVKENRIKRLTKRPIIRPGNNHPWKSSARVDMVL